MLVPCTLQQCYVLHVLPAAIVKAGFFKETQHVFHNGIEETALVSTQDIIDSLSCSECHKN